MSASSDPTLQVMEFAPSHDEWLFPGAAEPTRLTAAELDEYGPYDHATICAGGYRNFNGTFDGAIYQEIAGLAKAQFEGDAFRQRFLIASYFKWRGVSWKGLS